MNTLKVHQVANHTKNPILNGQHYSFTYSFTKRCVENLFWSWYWCDVSGCMHFSSQWEAPCERNDDPVASPSSRQSRDSISTVSCHSVRCSSTNEKCDAPAQTKSRGRGYYTGIVLKAEFSKLWLCLKVCRLGAVCPFAAYIDRSENCHTQK